MDTVPVVWERMLNDRGEATGGGGRERIERLIDSIGQWRRQQRAERQNNITAPLAAPSSLSALPSPVKQPTRPLVADRSERAEGTARGREGSTRGSSGTAGQQGISSLATLPLLKEKDDRPVTSKRRVNSTDIDSRVKRSRLMATRQAPKM